MDREPSAGPGKTTLSCATQRAPRDTPLRWTVAPRDAPPGWRGIRYGGGGGLPIRPQGLLRKPPAPPRRRCHRGVGPCGFPGAGAGRRQGARRGARTPRRSSPRDERDPTGSYSLVRRKNLWRSEPEIPKMMGCLVALRTSGGGPSSKGRLVFIDGVEAARGESRPLPPVGAIIEPFRSGRTGPGSGRTQGPPARTCPRGRPKTRLCSLSPFDLQRRGGAEGTGAKTTTKRRSPGRYPRVEGAAGLHRGTTR